MTKQNTSPEATIEANAVHHATRKGADMSLARKEISPDSHRAVLAGELSLEEARSLGRNAGPSGPAPKTLNKNDRSRPCLCQCGDTTSGSLFRQGHDMRVFRLLREHLTKGRELPSEVVEYAEQSGKMARVKAKLVEEDRRRAEKEANKKPKK